MREAASHLAATSALTSHNFSASLDTQNCVVCAYNSDFVIFSGKMHQCAEEKEK